ncbi:MAG: hypothetical protein H0S80_02740 [Desulfovibrionaceae bacterium]|nr:hypothetical protein [Desulfovibrionaceae bacterium]
MTKELCLVHANCQGEPLIERLRLCPEFEARYHCALVTNYTREPVPGDRLSRCSLFLYQHLGPKWGGLASASLLDRLPADARSLCIPNMFFKGYWPTWSGAAGFDYRCTLLDELADSDLPDEEATLIYLHTDMAAKFDLLTMITETLGREQDRESHTPVKYLDVIRGEYRAEQLFNTVNHPRARLMNHAAEGVLDALGFTSPGREAMGALGEPFPEFEQPVNPKVAAHFGWDFAGPDRRYRVYGRDMSFARWVANYVFARRAGITDFIGFLQGDDIAI